MGPYYYEIIDIQGDYGQLKRTDIDDTAAARQRHRHKALLAVGRVRDHRLTDGRMHDGIYHR